MNDGQGQDTVLSFHCGHLIDERSHRLERRQVHADHAAVEQRHGGSNLALCAVCDDSKEIACPLANVRVRVLLEQHNRVRLPDHLRRDVAVQVQLDPDRCGRSDDLADPRDDIGFAVVVAVGDHGAVQTEQDDVDRHRGFEGRQQLVSQAFVHRPRRNTSRLRKGKQAEGEFPPAFS